MIVIMAAKWNETDNINDLICQKDNLVYKNMQMLYICGYKDVLFNRCTKK